jgi:hypothetical protein
MERLGGELLPCTPLQSHHSSWSGQSGPELVEAVVVLSGEPSLGDPAVLDVVYFHAPRPVEGLSLPLPREAAEPDAVVIIGYDVVQLQREGSPSELEDLPEEPENLSTPR